MPNLRHQVRRPLTTGRHIGYGLSISTHCGIVIRSLTAFATLIVLLFANALLFASHAAEEMRSAFGNRISHHVASPENPHSAGHDHAHGEEDARSGGTAHRDCCSSHAPHSHDLADGPAPVLILLISFSFLTFPELISHMPEVFLDRFVPPQNLA